MFDWEPTAKKLGFIGEKEMWEQLYNKYSLTDLAVRFSCGVNTIRNRIAKFGIEIKARGGPNNLKIDLDKELLDDIIQLGVKKAANKRGIKPQVLYQRIYYKYGLTVKGLREAAEADKQSPSSPGYDNAPPSSGE